MPGFPQKAEPEAEAYAPSFGQGVQERRARRERQGRME